MSERSRFNPFTAVLYAFFPLLVGAGVLFVLVIIGGRAVQGYEIRQEARAMEQSIDRLRRENRQLTQELDYFRSDQYVEKVAREELGLVRPNDVPVVMTYPDGDRPSSVLPAATALPIAAPRGKEMVTWQRWLTIFVDTE